VNKKWLLIGLFVSAAGASAAGCKQGNGERCQSDEDCSSGSCSSSTPQICVAAGDSTDEIDASIPLDAAAVAPEQPAR
jgi:hypothetical protein